jgi:hypothetical protein
MRFEDPGVRATLGALALIALLALVARTPGLDWGFRHRPFSRYHPDEGRLAQTALQVRNGEGITDFYPAGFPVQAGWLAGLLRIDAGEFTDLLPVMRRLSLAYGVLTVLLVYALARQCALAREPALAAASIYALAGIPAVHAHFATADSGVVFWIVLTMLLMLHAVRRASLLHVVLAGMAAGMALAFKGAVVALLPIVAGCLLMRRAGGLAALIPAAGASLLVAVIGAWGQVSPDNLGQLWHMIKSDNMNVVKVHEYSMNPPMLLCQLIPAMGLASFSLIALGAAAQTRRIRGWMTPQATPIVGIIVVPALVEAVMTCRLAIPFIRHLLPTMPALAVLGGYGWRELGLIFARRGQPGRQRRFAVPALLYQAVYVASIQFQFVHDTRSDMHRWMEHNLPPSAAVYVTRYASAREWGDVCRPTPREHAEYILTHEGYYRRYLRSPVNPLHAVPSTGHLYHMLPDGPFLRALMRGRIARVEIHRESVTYWTPELILFKAAFGSFPDIAGDTILFRRLSPASGDAAHIAGSEDERPADTPKR